MVEVKVKYSTYTTTRGNELHCIGAVRQRQDWSKGSAKAAAHTRTHGHCRHATIRIPSLLIYRPRRDGRL